MAILYTNLAYGNQASDQYQREGDAAMAAGVDAARQGVGAVEAGGSQVYAQIQNSEQSALAARAAAEGMGQDISGIRDAATRTQQQAYNIQPYAKSLKNYGDQLWNQSRDVIGSGSNLMLLSDNLLGLDDGVGGVIGEYVKTLKNIDPRSYVSLAASDVQKSGDNALAQARRELSRRGVNGTSGAALAQERLYKQTLAATLAGAKTKAYREGLADQMGALRAALSDAMSMRSQADQDITAGNGVAGSAIQAQKEAANVEKTVADVLAESGTLFAGAASAGAAQAGAFNQSAGVFTSNANAINSYLGNLSNAYGNLSNAQLKYGEYMADVAEGYAAYEAYREKLSNERLAATLSDSERRRRQQWSLGIQVVDNNGVPYEKWSDTAKMSFDHGF